VLYGFWRGLTLRPEERAHRDHAPSAAVHRESPAGGRSTPPATQTAQPNETSANSGSQAPSPARAGSTLGDTYDEALGEVFKVRIDDLLK
jgi:hypothetical protein